MITGAADATEVVEPSSPHRGAPAHPAAMPPVFLRGETVAGRFRIDSFLGQGGMGQVFAATDLELGSVVALKAIRPDLADRPTILRRFKREVHLARQVTHPNVCRVFDLITHHAPDDRWGRARAPILALSMELLEGTTLAQRLAVDGPMPDRAAELLRQLAAALDAAHRAGIVHGDLAPSNILWVADREAGAAPRLVVTDFGLARLEEPDAEHLVGFVGTRAYASPERLAGRRGGRRSDIYSLGMVLHEVLIGTPPARRADGATEFASTVPPPWRAILARCLEPEPAARFASGEAAVEALEAALRARSVSSRTHALGLVLAGVVSWATLTVTTGLPFTADSERTPGPQPSLDAPGSAVSPTWSPSPRRAAARRLYANGLEHLETFDLLPAIDALEKAHVLEPEAPAVLSALARAWNARGYDGEAAQFAAAALDAARAAPRSERLVLEAHYARLHHDQPAAISAFQALWTLFPDTIGHGMELARTLAEAGQLDAAREVLEQVRAQGEPAGGTPQFWLLEAEIAEVASDFEQQLTSARRVLSTAKSSTAASIPALGEALLHATTALHQLGRRAEAAEHARLTRQHFASSGDARGLACTVLRLAEARFPDLTTTDTDSALETFQRLGDREREARLLVVVARSQISDLNTLPAARRMLERALDLAREIDNSYARAEALNGLAVLTYVSEDEARSVELFRQAWQAARDSGRPRLIAGVGMNLGLTLRSLGDFDAARPHLEQAVEVFRRLQSLGDLSKALNNLTKVHRALGDYAAAERCGREALDIARRLGDRNLEGQALRGLATIARLRGDDAGSADLLRQALAIYRTQSGSDLMTAALELSLVDRLTRLRQWREAEELLTSLESRHPLDATQLSHRIRLQRAQTLLARGRDTEAARQLLALYPRTLTFENDRLRSHRLRAARQLEAASGGNRLVRDRLHEIATRARTTDSRRLELEADLEHARLELASGDAESARRRLETLLERARDSPWILSVALQELHAIPKVDEVHSAEPFE
ncbi:MAG: tetratricopeptide repeat protein [Acidobacteriota bacterium]